MKIQLLPYSNWIEYTVSTEDSYYGEDPFGWDGFQESLSRKSLKTERDLGKVLNAAQCGRMDALTSCPYCSNRLQLSEVYKGGGQEWKRADTWECPACRWWLYCFSKNKFYPFEFFRNEFYEGVVYAFDHEKGDPPLLELRHKIAQEKIDLRDLTPRQMELLVGSVFRDYLGAKVQHIGGPGDDGIDLLVSEEPPHVAIQVKRRENAKPSESVSTVRDLIGSIVLADIPKGVIVSTAQAFSEPAKKAAASPRLARLGIELSLYAYDRLREIINATAPQPHPWLQVPHIRGLHKLWGLAAAEG
jgi:hypothetical protein